MKASIKEIAHLIGAEVEGDPETVIDQISGLDQAGKGCLSFLANPKYEPLIYATGAEAVIVSTDFKPKRNLTPTLLRVADPYSAFSGLLEFVAAQQSNFPRLGIHSSAIIEEGANVDPEAHIGSYCYVSAGATIDKGAILFPFVFVGKEAAVGQNSTLHAHVTIYHGCRIGKQVTIHAGSVIGADGFGFAPQSDGSFKKVPQLGIVEIEDDVEIGANSCIDRATIGTTIIRRGAKIDNLVQIAHNVEIGSSSAVAAQTGISGSTKLGKHVMVGGQAGFVGHIEIADGTKIDAQSGVNRSIQEPGKAFRGSPIQPHRQQLKSELMFRKLAEMEQRIRMLEQANSNQPQ